MSGLRLVPLGVGDAFSALYYSSCLAVEAEGAWLLIDCPHPIRKILREAVPGLDLDQVAAVALSHAHADHCSGLECAGFYSRFTLGRRLPLLAHADVTATLWTGHLAAGMEWVTLQEGAAPERRGFDEFFDLIPLYEDQAVRVGPFEVECRRTVHSVPTTGFRVRAAGRCLGYSADTAYHPPLLDWLSSADLIVHETNPGLMHTEYARLAALPESMRRRMRVIHYSDTFDLEARAIEPLRQGRVVEV
jgi:ribonuclease BN (tRNA processing enzyme)